MVVALSFLFPACGPRSAPPPGAVEFSAQTEGTPTALSSHLDALQYRYQNSTAGDPRLARANFNAYSTAVVATAKALWDSASATYDQKKKSAQQVLEILHERVEDDEQTYEQLLSWTDRIEAEAPPDSDLIPTAAYYRYLGVKAAAGADGPGSPAERRALIDAALHLGRTRPSRPETSDILSETGDMAMAEGLDEEAVALFTLLAETFPETPSGQRALGMARRLQSQGEVIDDIEGRSLRGEPLDIEDFRGKVVLVIFWGTEWHRGEALPIERIAEYRDRHSEDDLALLGILYDPDPRLAERFLAKYEINWPQIHSPAAFDAMPPAPPLLALRFGIETSPYYMLIDREGRWVASGETLAAIEPMLQTLLGDESASDADAAESAGTADSTAPGEANSPPTDSTQEEVLSEDTEKDAGNSP